MTDKWVREYKRGLGGDIPESTTLSVAINHYLGLCKVSVPIVTDNKDETTDGDYACDCDLYNLYLTCPHSVFVRVKTGVLDVENMTARSDGKGEACWENTEEQRPVLQERRGTLT